MQLCTSAQAGARSTQNLHGPPPYPGLSSPESSPVLSPAPIVPAELLGHWPLLHMGRYTLFSKFMLWPWPLPEMGFSWVPIQLAHSLTYFGSLLKCHLLSASFTLEAPAPTLPFPLLCLIFLNSIIMSIFSPKFLVLFAIFFPWNGSLWKMEILSASLSAVSLAP